MHLLDLISVCYIIAWVIGGILLLRDSRPLPISAKIMAFLAIVIGPPGMLLYAGFRYIADSMPSKNGSVQARQKRTIIDV